MGDPKEAIRLKRLRRVKIGIAMAVLAAAVVVTVLAHIGVVGIVAGLVMSWMAYRYSGGVIEALSI